MNGDQNTNNGDQQTEETEDVNLQKSLDDQLSSMNDLIKSKKTYTEDEMKEMMKDKKVQEYMKENGYVKKDEEDEEDEEEKMKKSLESIDEEHGEVIDAIPVLKSFSKVLETISKQVQKVEGTVANLQKSMDDNIDLQKSFGGVIGAQSELIKSINDEIEALGNVPGKVKGVISQKDLFKSALADDDAENKSKLSSANVEKIRNVLIKSAQEKEISALSVGKWEQTGYDMSVFSKAELETIESKL
jgi:hypothetical protein